MFGLKKRGGPHPQHHLLRRNFYSDGLGRLHSTGGGQKTCAAGDGGGAQELPPAMALWRAFLIIVHLNHGNFLSHFAFSLRLTGVLLCTGMLID